LKKKRYITELRDSVLLDTVLLQKRDEGISPKGSVHDEIQVDSRRIFSAVSVLFVPMA
jgi:hypothetical protein